MIMVNPFNPNNNNIFLEGYTNTGQAFVRPFNGNIKVMRQESNIQIDPNSARETKVEKRSYGPNNDTDDISQQAISSVKRTRKP